MLTERERRSISVAALPKHFARNAVWQAVKKPMAGLLYGSAFTLGLMGQAQAFEQIGLDVNNQCTAGGRDPATPFNAQAPTSEDGCFLCHNNGNFGPGPGRDAYEAGNLDFFCVAGAEPPPPPPGEDNAPPVLDPIGNKTAETGVELTFEVVASDPDENGITLTASGLPTGAEFEDNGDGSGTFSWTPTPDQTANQTVTFTATDDGEPPQSDSEEISISLGGANQAPVLDPIGAQSTEVGQLLEIALSATDADNNNLAFSAGDLPTGATLTDNGDGTANFTWTPEAAQAGNHTVSFTVTDDGDPVASDAEDVTITVAADGGEGNLPPVLAPIGNKTVAEGQQLSFTATASDQDGKTVRLSANNLPAGANFVDNLDGSAQFTWTPANADVGTHEITVVATDDGNPAATDSENIVVTVTAAGGEGNRPPVLNRIGNQQANVGSALNLTMTGSDPDGGQLTFAAQNVPPGATFSDRGDGSASFSWTPAAADVGNHAVTVTLTDSGNPPISVNETFNIAVDDGSNKTNRPPVLEAVGGQSLVAGNAVNLRLRTTDPDGNSLHYLAIGKPAGSSFVDKGDGTAELTWTPKPEDIGLHLFLVLVADNGRPMEMDGEIVLLDVREGNGATEFQVHDAAIQKSQFFGDRLKVRGSVISNDSLFFNSYFGERVEVMDSSSGESIGAGRIDYNGSWTVQSAPLVGHPCKIVAQMAGMKKEMEVSGSSCETGGAEQDEDFVFSGATTNSAPKKSK